MDGVEVIFKRVWVAFEEANEVHIIGEMYAFITREYTSDISSWFDSKEACDECYMVNCHLWKDNYV